VVFISVKVKAPLYPTGHSINLEFEVDKLSNIVLEIFSVSGQKMDTYEQDHFAAGTHVLRHDVALLPVGAYFVPLNQYDFEGALLQKSVVKFLKR